MKLHYTLLLFLLSAFTLKAQIIHIPSDYPTIQEGISAATGSDTILVEEGTYYENINFLGKPVTVASEFILDGDTSHIPKTIIDGSQFADWKRASTVLMESGEDTTSVLMGFTITGGEGTRVIRGNWTDLYGAGINIMHSGGRILHNIIEGNHLTVKDSHTWYAGGGINACVNRNHTAIIRKNIIRDNSITAPPASGAGILLEGGRCIVEDNTISSNRLEGTEIGGAGILWYNNGEIGTIEEVIIRNNIITNNEGIHTGTGYSFGGAIATGLPFQEGMLKIYNNIISHNTIEGEGGGLYNWTNPVVLYNNTFYNNQATDGGNQIGLEEGRIYMFNNIIWSDIDNGKEDFIRAGNFVASNNLLEQTPEWNPVNGETNLYMEPVFKSGSFNLDENSPGIGRGIDSMLVGSIWYKAPATDFKGDTRPSDADQFVDMGANESEYERPVYSIADLALLGMVGHSTDPPFHKDTLNYLLVKNPGNKVIGNWRIFTVDNLATVEMDTAADLFSENELDRTSTILVTASDGMTQKEYTVVYKYLSSIAELESLRVSMGTLNPIFDPSILAYYDTIPYGMRLPTPEVICFASDTSATVVVQPAQDIYNQFEILRTTTIYVTSPNDVVNKEYTILFTVDLTRPELTIVQDSVELGEDIGVVIYEPGQVFLVPENTPGIHDSIVNAQLVMMEAGDIDTVFLSTEGLEAGNYWLYTCGEHQSISEHQTVTTVLVEGISGTQADHFRVYPTPVVNTLYFETPFPVKSVELYNLLGKSVLKVLNPDGKMDVSHLPEGIYVLRTVFENRDVVTTRIIKF